MGKSELCRTPRVQSARCGLFCDVAWTRITVRGWEMMTWPPTQGTRTVQPDHKPVSFKGGDTKPRNPFSFTLLMP